MTTPMQLFESLSSASPKSPSVFPRGSFGGWSLICFRSKQRCFNLATSERRSETDLRYPIFGAFEISCFKHPRTTYHVPNPRIRDGGSNVSFYRFYLYTLRVAEMRARTSWLGGGRLMFLYSSVFHFSLIARDSFVFVSSV